jgi:PAS domain S-box-containing protein
MEQPAFLNQSPQHADDGPEPVSLQAVLSLVKEEERKRKEAEEKLTQTELVFELFMEHAPLRAWITDRKGYVHYMNQQYKQAFGDIFKKGKNIFELFPSPWAEEYLREIEKVLASNAPCERVSEGRKLDGTTGLFRVTRFPLMVDGETMVAGWAVEITEQVQLEKKLLQEARNKKKQIIRSIIETQEKERRELSVELHDNVNQILSSCQLMLEVALDKKELAEHLTEKTYESLKTAITEIRKISHELNPSAIEDLGLSEAISEMVEKINSAGKLRIFFSYREFGRHAVIGMTDKIAVYRIVQEQLNNIIKHAHAHTVHITLYYKLSRLYLHMEDDGIGFDMKQVKKGLGLKNIQHRVEYYQGKLKIDTAHGKGCKLKVLLSIPA